MDKLRKLFLWAGCLSLVVFATAFAVEKSETEELQPKTSSSLAWSRLQEIGKIWATNTVQTVDIGGWGHSYYTPLPIVSRSSNGVIIYAEDRLGYALAPLNWLYCLNQESLPKEGPKTMFVRGVLKKYNEKVRELILPNDHGQ